MSLTSYRTAPPRVTSSSSLNRGTLVNMWVMTIGYFAISDHDHPAGVAVGLRARAVRPNCIRMVFATPIAKRAYINFFAIVNPLMSIRSCLVCVEGRRHSCMAGAGSASRLPRVKH